MAKIEFVDELPKGAVTSANKNKVFTDDVIEALRENPGKWGKIEGATGQGAAAFVERMKKVGETVEYQSVDTGKPTGKARNSPQGGGTYMPTIKDIYVRYVG